MLQVFFAFTLQCRYNSYKMQTGHVFLYLLLSGLKVIQKNVKKHLYRYRAGYFVKYSSFIMIRKHELR